jgi:sorbitol/mannitol transport system permease protein
MMPRARRGRRRIGIALAWIAAVLWAFPLLYMLLTSFKAGADAVPPSLWILHPTLQNFKIVLQQQILHYLANSAIISVTTVAICILVGVPTSYAIVFGRLKRADNLLFWFLSTTLLPPVAMIIPVFLLFRVFGLLDTLGGMILIFSGANIPIVIWMIRPFLLDVPREILESADIDGASRLRSFFSTVVPLCRQGIVSIGLLVFIFVWNEFFFSINRERSPRTGLHGEFHDAGRTVLGQVERHLDARDSSPVDTRVVCTALAGQGSDRGVREGIEKTRRRSSWIR